MQEREQEREQGQGQLAGKAPLMRLGCRFWVLELGQGYRKRQLVEVACMLSLWPRPHR